MSCSGRKLNKLSKKTSNKIAKKSKRSLSKKTQRGGVSNACVLDYTNDKAIYSGAGEANAHNLNPQASLDLDNKFMNYGGPIPLEQSGGSNCGDDGVGTSRPKTESFKQYLKNLDADLTFKGGSNCGSHQVKQNGGSNCGSHQVKQNGGSNCGSHQVKQNGGSNCGSHHVKQNGAGYIVDTSQYVGGQPIYKAYDDNAPPAIIGGQIVSGQPDQPVCGNGALTGGSKKIRRNKKSKKSKSKKSKSKKSKSKKSKSKKSKSKKSKKSKSQRGGDFVAIGSKPADFSTAFDGPKGVFNYPDDMMTREFGEKQPNYSVNAI
jgi:hypothetical protein